MTIPVNVVYGVKINDMLTIKPYTGIYLKVNLMGKDKETEEYNGKKKNPAQRLSINKLHARESSIFSGLEDSSVSDEDWNDESEVEEGAL